MPTLLRAANLRHDAIGAKLVAADHDANISLESIGPHRRIAERVIALEAALDFVSGGFLAIQTERQLGPAGFAGLDNQFRKPGELPRTANNIHVGRAAEDQFLILLSHAAQDTDNRVGIPPLVRPKACQGAINLVLGMLTNAAGVEENYIRAIHVVR